VKFTQSLKQFIIKRPQGNKFFSPLPHVSLCDTQRKRNKEEVREEEKGNEEKVEEKE
jgi:hypothetical protein